MTPPPTGRGRVVILYPTGLNWFYEAVARHAHEDLTAEGVPAVLLTAPELMAIPAADLGPGSDVLIVNFYESAQSLVMAGFAGYSDAVFGRLRDRVAAFDRRVLVNLDSIYTDWFRLHMDACRGADGSVLTDIFDLTMLPQTDAAVLSGCRYTWVPECLTRAETAAVPAYDAGERTFPWAMIGHATDPRTVIADALARRLGPDGFLFLLGLRPSRADGKVNLTPDGVARVLRHTRYYVWASHHGYPYHEGLRAPHAVLNGAVPVKLEGPFAWAFEPLPWVYRDVDELVETIDRDGPGIMFDRAADFIRSRGTLGRALADALAGRPHPHVGTYVARAEVGR